MQPEINVVNIVTHDLVERLTGLRFAQGQDFDVDGDYIDGDRLFQVSEAAQVALSEHSHFLKIQDPRPIIDWLQKSSR